MLGGPWPSELRGGRRRHREAGELGCGRLPCGWPATTELGALPSLWGAFRHDGGDGRPTGKTQVAKARFPIRSHRLDSTWRPAGSVAEAAWVSALGSGGGVVFLVVGQANLLGSSSPSL